MCGRSLRIPPSPSLPRRSADAKTREEITEMAVTNCEESKEGSILILAGGAAEETCTSQRSPHSFLGLPAAIASIRAAGGRPRASGLGRKQLFLGGRAEASARLGGGNLDVGVIWGWLCIGFASQQRLTTSSIHLQGGFMRREVAHS